jgi:hypothetical protein
MPEMHKGIGTRFIGRKNEQPDGSYTTTEWFVILLMPVRYLGTFKVKLNPAESFWKSPWY